MFNTIKNIIMIVFLVFMGIGCGSSGDDPTGSGSNIPIDPWTRLLGSTVADEGRAVTVDSSGNVFIAGYTDGALPGMSAPDGRAAFLAKYDASGERQWIKYLDASGNQSAMALTLDSSGNIFITGGTTSALFGQTFDGGQDVLVAKYDSNGDCVWGKLFGTDESSSQGFQENGQKILVDSSGNIYVLGYTDGGLGSSYIGYKGFFLLKLNASGSQIWLKNFGISSGNLANQGYGLAMNGDYLYIGGCMGDDFNSQTHQGTDGDGDMIVLKISASDGSTIWTRMAGSVWRDCAKAVTTDSSGNIYLTGNSDGDFDGKTNPSNGQYRTFVIKYDSSGNKLWSLMQPSPTTTNYAELGNGITMANGYLYVAGYSANTSAYVKDIVIFKYNTEGDLQDTKVYDSGNIDEAFDIVADTNGTLYTTGSTGASLDDQTHSGGNYDVFLKKLSF